MPVLHVYCVVTSLSLALTFNRAKIFHSLVTMPLLLRNILSESKNKPFLLNLGTFVCIFENLEIAQVKRWQFQNVQKSQG